MLHSIVCNVCYKKYLISKKIYVTPNDLIEELHFKSNLDVKSIHLLTHHTHIEIHNCIRVYDESPPTITDR